MGAHAQPVIIGRAAAAAAAEAVVRPRKEANRCIYSCRKLLPRADKRVLGIGARSGDLLRPPPVSVAGGQLWELRTTVLGGVARFRVERVESGMAHGTFVETGRKAYLHVSTLERRSRGARLVECADGSPPGSRPVYKRPPEVERTASDFRRKQPPRGLTPTERAAWLRDST
jgi:hypothetical protein